ncbi:MAG: putative toxin-antitoxin system toxin component, PIN family [Candidatus Handelsmanbacteria bacterium RIFCSPLOWO2_12_FULL_64_10]|uniref:Putative toxin-antitoxin system toxin component, PIN family n=1 Tax=Handelsmanbacteria sp. (strain RIFCSPLOWO2_12_FULL_64_10) TaxID=1817868 RepID=A0A1F6CAF4_HANXR|nr:MAG: putative toxin-antitoxin system toxin component, PIN family [Candidatus Handelsmanbacteria bacterium RIFCSPLOWO2_12_FULL_64_10]
MISPMKVILDTNVVVASGWKSEGTCRQVLDTVFYRKIADCYVSSAILLEYEETAQDRRFRHIHREISRQIRRVRRNARLVEPREMVTILSDPDDNKFLELAQAVNADYLITGDLKAFGELLFFGSTHIVTPAEFLDVLEAMDRL